MAAQPKKIELLRVTAELRAPIVVDHDVHIDGLLAFAQVLRHRDKYPQSLDRTTPIDNIKRVPVPLQRCDIDGRGVWLASAAELADDAEAQSAYLTRRKDGEDVEHLTKKFHRSQGPGRDILERRQAVAVSSVSWLCCGHRRSIMQLLDLVHHIGARRRHGYGDVARWSVDPAEFDPVDIVATGRRSVARHVPIDWWSSASQITRGALEAPYWHPHAQEPVAAIGSKATLRDDVASAIEESVR